MDSASAHVVERCQGAKRFVAQYRIGRFDIGDGNVDIACGAYLRHLIVVERERIARDFIAKSLYHRVTQAPNAATAFGQAYPSSLIATGNFFPMSIDRIDRSSRKQETQRPKRRRIDPLVSLDVG